MIKIFIAGLPNSGKTTFVATCSEISPLSTERKGFSGESTTVAMDFGLIKAAHNREIHVYGLPGHERFSFMWEILQKNAVGFIYLVSATEKDDLKIRTHFEETFRISYLPSVIGVTKIDLVNKPENEISRIKTLFADFKDIPLLTIDPRNKLDVRKTITTLIEHSLRIAEVVD